MAVKIIIENQGASFEKVKQVYDTIYSKLMKPDPTRAVKHVAEIWSQNYRTEGSMVGGWPALAQSTIDTRLRQGFGAGPVLFRQGSLYAMSTLFFMQGQKGTVQSWSTYGGRNIATSASLEINGGKATLSMGGPKTVHQTGSWTPPRRAYWFSDRNAIIAAREGTIEWIKDEVVGNGSGY
jgi:hypothetical protein